eukprot:scaffold51_cov401-Prasinococcus_capsulatus_cf.AAC.47
MYDASAPSCSHMWLFSKARRSLPLPCGLAAVLRRMASAISSTKPVVISVGWNLRGREQGPQPPYAATHPLRRSLHTHPKSDPLRYSAAVRTTASSPEARAAIGAAADSVLSGPVRESALAPPRPVGPMLAGSVAASFTRPR